jgi:hypothetical protein
MVPFPMCEVSNCYLLNKSKLFKKHSQAKTLRWAFVCWLQVSPLPLYVHS